MYHTVIYVRRITYITVLYSNPYGTVALLAALLSHPIKILITCDSFV